MIYRCLWKSADVPDASVGDAEARIHVRTHGIQYEAELFPHAEVPLRNNPSEHRRFACPHRRLPNHVLGSSTRHCLASHCGADIIGLFMTWFVYVEKAIILDFYQ
jgi:hypothetical protein